MLVPANRLVTWILCTGFPIAVVAAVVPEVRLAALAGSALFALVVILDAIRARGRLNGLSIELPETVRLQREKEGSFDLLVRLSPARQLTLGIGLPFPPEIEAREEVMLVQTPADAERSRVTLSCFPRARGAYPLEACFVQTASPFGFWVTRRRLPARCELRVYPNLAAERKHVAALFLNRGHLGLHTQRQSGRGREFEKLREYVSGDSYEDIHWKATARRREPVTKVYQVERTQEIYVIIDSSRLMGRGEALERYVNAALFLGMAAEQQGDLFGLMTFDDKVRAFVRAKGGLSHFDSCSDALYRLQPRMVSPDFDEVGIFLRTRLRKRALLVFLTALDDPVLAESFTDNVGLICRQHLVLANMIRPDGAHPLFAGGKVSSVTGIYDALAGHMTSMALRELGTNLKRRGVQFAMLDHEHLSAQLVSQYVAVKGRQLL